MSDRVVFSQLAEQFGIESSPLSENLTHPNVWRKLGGTRLLAYLREQFQPGDLFEFDGHGDCWLMLAVMYALRDCQISAFIGGDFNRSLPIVAYQLGSDPAPGQPCTFTLEEQGEDLLLTVHLDPNRGPFDLPFEDIVAPEIPQGKNLYIKLDGRHLLFTFPLSLTYGAICRTVVMDYDGECFCAVSNTPALQVGDLVENPF